MSNVVKSKWWFENVWKGSTPKIIPFHRWNTMKTSEHHPNIVQKYVQKWLKVIEFVQNKSCLVVTVSEWLKLRSFTSFFMLFMFFPSPVTKRHVCLQQDGWSAGCAHQVLQDTASSMRLVVLHHPFSWLSIIHVYIYIEAQGWGFPGASRNPQSWCYTRKVVLVYRWGGGGGVITSCEVRWMMLNPGRCCSVGRCCHVGFVVVYRRGGGGGGGGCNNVMWSALGDVEYHPGRCSSFRPWFSSALSHVLLLNRTTKIKETALQMVSMFHTSLVIHGRCKMFLFQHGQTSSSSAMKMEVRLIKPFQRKT